MVMNTNTKRESGRKAQLANIQAAKAVADIVTSTLGPQSMLKMLLDPMGGIVMTNDGYVYLYLETPFLDKLMCSTQPPRASLSWQEYRMKKWEMAPHQSSL